MQAAHLHQQASGRCCFSCSEGRWPCRVTGCVVGMRPSDAVTHRRRSSAGTASSAPWTPRACPSWGSCRCRTARTWHCSFNVRKGPDHFVLCSEDRGRRACGHRAGGSRNVFVCGGGGARARAGSGGTCRACIRPSSILWGSLVTRLCIHFLVVQGMLSMASASSGGACWGPCALPAFDACGSTFRTGKVCCASLSSGCRDCAG
jgi:hypothetical protein